MPRRAFEEVPASPGRSVRPCAVADEECGRPDRWMSFWAVSDLNDAELAEFRTGAPSMTARLPRAAFHLEAR